ncbi:MFS transporter [Ruminococcaceae bacterium R-25]|nr:MFS transporter [Ruminococcaceae bacterium R-25]SUQ10762.1 MFS/sugar transport protein [Oscillospiraceae bacterium]
METKKGLTGKEKFAYGIGAVGKDMVYMLSASYVLYYFQDIMKTSAIAMGFILLIARVFDAFNDPIMGVIVAKTKTKWGKFRPWLLIGTITNAVILFLMFAAPPTLDGKGLIAYAAVTYILWGVTYTMMDIPYWSMIPAFTQGGKEREGLSALGRSCAGVGSAIVTILTVMAVTAIGSSLTAKSTTNITKQFSSDNTKINTYVIELDKDGNPTSNVIEYAEDKTDVSVTITGSERAFEDVYSFNNDNAKYEFTVNGINAETSKVEFVMDSETSGEAGLVFYVDSDSYNKISGSDSVKATLTMNSTLEVERVGFKYFSLIVGILFIVFIGITCLCIKEKSSVDMQTPSVKQMFKALLGNDQAMTVVITIVLFNTATYITSNLLIYFFKYDLAGSNWQGNYTLFNTFAGAMQILAMMLFFPLLRKVFDTIKIFYVGVFAAIGGYIILLALSLLGTKSVYPFFVPGFFIMGAVGILNVICTIFLANTCDYGELKNGRRDESVIFSMQTFVVKLASGIAALVASVCLTIFKIQEQSNTEMNLSVLLEKVSSIKNNVVETIDTSAVFGLRMVMTLTPIFVLVIALLIFKAKYILTDKKLDEITKELKSRS